MKNKTWPNEKDVCYDCGSNIPGHHTPSCDFAEPDDKRDLPEQPGTQWWTREVPAELK